METKEAVLGRFDELIRQAQLAMAATRTSDSEYIRIRTSGMNLVRRSCGAESDHYRAMEKIADDREMNANPYYLKHIMGSIQAARDDFAGGYLFDLRAQVAAEILGSFLDQAQYLLEGGHHHAAASVAGAVLEDSLRKLANSKGLAVPPRTTIEGLNVLLAKGSVYPLLVQKQVTAYAELRNNADHGHFDRVKREDVEAMVKWTLQFDSQYLA